MKILIVSIVTFFYSNEKLVGLWKSIDDNSIKYLNIKSNGVFLEIKDNTTSRFNYKEKENTLQMQKRKKESKGHLAQIVRRKNSTKIKPSGKIYKRSKKIEDE